MSSRWQSDSSPFPSWHLPIASAPPILCRISSLFVSFLIIFSSSISIQARAGAITGQFHEPISSYVRNIHYFVIIALNIHMVYMYICTRLFVPTQNPLCRELALNLKEKINVYIITNYGVSHSRQLISKLVFIKCCILYDIIVIHLSASIVIYREHRWNCIISDFETELALRASSSLAKFILSVNWNEPDDPQKMPNSSCTNWDKNRPSTLAPTGLRQRDAPKVQLA